MNMIDTLNNRRSVRKFTREKINESTLNNIMNYAKNIPMLFDDLEVEFHLIENDYKKRFQSLFNINAPYYLCISAQTDDISLVNAGNVMQQISLYLTSIGYGSCFIGNGLPKNIKEPIFKFDYITTLAFGITEEPLFRKKEDTFRLPEEKTIYYKSEVSNDIREIVNIARLSPSYLNSQPWRFVVYNNRIHVFAIKASLLNSSYKQMRMLDVGISVANLLVAAEEYWIGNCIVRLDSLDNKDFNHNDYVLTILIDHNLS